ncbi:Short-chain dehydrogenase [Actinacidiphila alni]|uniref:Short-chain dehydrogenase n=1 Tax=Actinacidiphila alni TaxID=380248 RepID=A0A1I2J3J0_9ACTN|nr:SDR family oxidoreductase [Actinacidiphila alni]SFF47291.1 Short-chain dehydrogenase [Actinacidiphila alni]
MREAVIVGGTSGVGRALAAHYVGRGRSVVVTGRDRERAELTAADLTAASGGSGSARGLALDLSRPHDLAAALADIGEVDRLVLAAIERDRNTVADYDVDRAVRLATLKLVGYTEVVHALAPRLTDDGSVLLFGGVARERPYPGSTTVSAVNGGVTGLTATLAVELAPVRVNALHPGLIVDTPYWSGQDAVIEAQVARTLTRRGVTTDAVVDAAVLLLENPGIDNVNLTVDGGWI